MIVLYLSEKNLLNHVILLGIYYIFYSSAKIGRVSHAFIIEFLPIREVIKIFPEFMLNVKSVQEPGGISVTLQEDGDGI